MKKLQKQEPILFVDKTEESLLVAYSYISNMFLDTGAKFYLNKKDLNKYREIFISILGVINNCLYLRKAEIAG